MSEPITDDEIKELRRMRAERDALHAELLETREAHERFATRVQAERDEASDRASVQQSAAKLFEEMYRAEFRRANALEQELDAARSALLRWIGPTDEYNDAENQKASIHGLIAIVDGMITSLGASPRKDHGEQ